MRPFAMTMSFNEPFMLPRWVSYYSQQIGMENLFVVDHGTTDDSLSCAAGCNIIHLPKSEFDDWKRASFLGEIHTALLKYYDAGFVCDVDEFLIADPRKYESLIHFAEAERDARHYNAIGLEVLNIFASDQPLRADLPILHQRRHVYFNSFVAKPSMSNKPIMYSGGRHGSTLPISFHPDFYLFHLRDFDLEYRLARQNTTRQWDYSGDWGGHARVANQQISDVIHAQQRYASDVAPGFDFKAECDRVVEHTQEVKRAEGGAFFVCGDNFHSDKARLIPSEFCHLV